MLKRIFKIVIILVVLVALALGAYWYFDRMNNGAGSPITSTDTFHIGNFFPFGQGSTNATQNTPATGGTDADTGSMPGIPVTPPRLWQISTQPQAGAVVFNASGTPMVRYIDKATGNAFESSLKLVGTNRITNTTIPKVYEAVWQPSGKAVVLRFLADNNETIRTAFGRLTATSSVPDSFQEISAAFFPDIVTSLSLSHSTSTAQAGALAYVAKKLDGSTVYVTNNSGTGPKQIFESVINDMAVSWVNSTTLGLLTKPSGYAVGQFYYLKTDTGRLQKVLNGQYGLTALSNQDGTRILYSASSGSSFQTTLINPKTAENIGVNINTLPEKCVWATKTSILYCATPKTIPDAVYPDSWYQGRVSFNDSLWQIDATTGAATLVIDPKIAIGNEIDATNLMLSPDEDYLIFTNKKDSELWGLKI